MAAHFERLGCLSETGIDPKMRRANAGDNREAQIRGGRKILHPRDDLRKSSPAHEKFRGYDDRMRGAPANDIAQGGEGEFPLSWPKPPPGNRLREIGMRLPTLPGNEGKQNALRRKRFAIVEKEVLKAGTARLGVADMQNQPSHRQAISSITE
jgi:hypothetical protein